MGVMVFGRRGRGSSGAVEQWRRNGCEVFVAVLWFTSLLS